MPYRWTVHSELSEPVPGIGDKCERGKSIARSFGFIFFGMGIILLLLIIYAMVSRLVR